MVVLVKRCFAFVNSENKKGVSMMDTPKGFQGLNTAFRQSFKGAAMHRIIHR
jgi:hypothetical protein